MIKRKKNWFTVLSVVLCAALLAACGVSGETPPEMEAQAPSQGGAANEASAEAVGDAGEMGEDSVEMAVESASAISVSDHSTVYFTEDISPQGLMLIYQALGRQASGNVAVKISTGEAGNTHYLSPDLIGDLVQSVDGTIVECNTAYGGSRASTAIHYQVAEDHGFTAIANVVILDEESDISLPVANGKHLEADLVGARFEDYDFHIVLSHFKGHAMGGFGGAIKNMSIGYASADGKLNIHGAGNPGVGFGAAQDDFLESMAEAASAIVDAVGEENILYISVMNHLSVDCDCDGNPAEPDMHDIGILASLDPVALDQACVDLVYGAEDGASLIQRIESRNGTHTLDYAAEIGLGSQEYDLVAIDG